MIRQILVSAAALAAMWCGAGCMKKETPVPRHEAGNVQTAGAAMDATYKYQVYYSLKNNAAVSTNLKTAWDFGFETSAEGYHIVLNTAKSMFVVNTGKTDMQAVSVADTAGFSVNKKWDDPNGSLDHTAIGEWKGTNNVYIVDLGFSEMGLSFGFMKLQVQSVSATDYSIKFAKLDGSDETTMTVTKDTMYNLSFVSLVDKKQVAVEPPKTTWDIVFTQYTHVFLDEVPIMPYLVTGCLQNRYNTLAVVDTTHDFATIDLSTAMGLTLSSDINTVGYDWKSFTGSTYVIRQGLSYIIRDAENIYYKLRFIGFYDNNGVKGNPKWEYQRL